MEVEGEPNTIVTIIKLEAPTKARHFPTRLRPKTSGTAREEPWTKRKTLQVARVWLLFSSTVNHLHGVVRHHVSYIDGAKSTNKWVQIEQSAVEARSPT
ncbi:hypothetical protein Sjap_013195 [Stephania japonica]|uniref:Uncharacterized protein n=1 Tax=Stephania japonica TaxID=461633 RepID=A0AAP0NYD9_9MAGN